MTSTAALLWICVAGSSALFQEEPGGSPAASDAAEIVAIVGARIFTADDDLTVLENGTVLVEGERITRVGPRAEVAVPDGARIVDGQGRTLLPGLIDAHVHLGGGGGRFDRPIEGDPVVRAEQSLACGVTALLDLNAREDQLFPIRRDARNRLLPGLPRLFMAGAAISAPGGHGTELGFPCRILGGADQAVELIAGLAALQPDCVKIMFDPGGWGGVRRMPVPGLASLEALIGEAHGQGLKVLVHVMDTESAAIVLRAGADGLAHLPLDGPFEAELIELMLHRGAVVIPTLAVFEAQFRVAGDPSFLSGPLVRQFVDARVIESLQDPEWQRRQREALLCRYLESRWPEALDRVGRLADAGVPLLTGTDAGNPATFHGIALHAELAAMVAAGIEPAVALASATREPARFLGEAQRIGSVREGFEADLLLVDGNPLRRIEDSRNIALVMRSGAPVDRGGVATRAALRSAAPAFDASAVDSAEPRFRRLFDFEGDEQLPAHQLSRTGKRFDGTLARATSVIDHAVGNPTRYLRVAGEVEFRPPRGGSGGVTLLPAPGPAFDFSSFSGIRFRARASEAREFRISLQTGNVKDSDYHGIPFRADATWRPYRIPFQRMGQIGFGKRVRFDPERIVGIEFRTRTGQDGTFRLDLDDIELFR